MQTFNFTPDRGYVREEGINYYSAQDTAQGVLDSIIDKYPDARIVSYERGLAIQYHKSGPYYPELHGW